MRHSHRVKKYSLCGHNIVFRFLQPEQGTVILEAFVAKLIEDHDIDFIAFYVSQLPRTRQVMWYTKFLVGKSAFHFQLDRSLCLQMRSALQTSRDVRNENVASNWPRKSVWMWRISRALWSRAFEVGALSPTVARPAKSCSTTSTSPRKPCPPRTDIRSTASNG